MIPFPYDHDYWGTAGPWRYDGRCFVVAVYVHDGSCPRDRRFVDDLSFRYIYWTDHSYSDQYAWNISCSCDLP